MPVGANTRTKIDTKRLHDVHRLREIGSMKPPSDDAITALVRCSKLENIVILPPAGLSKVTLRLEKVTAKEALRRLCEACTPPVILTEHDDGFYYIEPKK